MLTVAGLEEKKSQPVIWDKQTPFQASNCSCLHAHWAKSQASHISIQSSWFTDYFCRLICHHKHVGVDRAYKLRAYMYCQNENNVAFPNKQNVNCNISPLLIANI